MTSVRRFVATAAATLMLLAGAAVPAAAQGDQDGLVNVQIGDVTILEDVDLALAAVVVGNICANLDVNAAVVAVQEVDQSGETFTCNQRGSGRAVAVTDA